MHKYCTTYLQVHILETRIWVEKFEPYSFNSSENVDSGSAQANIIQELEQQIKIMN